MSEQLTALQPDYDQVRVMLYQPRSVFREVVRGLLQGAGFRNFAYAEDLDDLAKRLSAPRFQLVVIHEEGDAGEEGESIELVRRLRHGDLGGDPFLPAVISCPQVTDIIARAAVNVGVDQLWTIPVRSTVVQEGIDALVMRRPPFLVTTDYMGPDRRKSARRGNEIPHIEVPNALRNVLLGESAPASITAYRRLFDRLRVERQVDQIKWLAARFNEAGQDAERHAVLVKRLEDVALDVRERIARTRHRGQHRLSQRLLELAVTMHSGMSDEHLAELEKLRDEFVEKIQPVVAIGGEVAAMSGDE